VGVILRKRVGFATPIGERRYDARRSAPRRSPTRRDRWRDTMTDVTRRKLKVATTSLAGCFGCHMSLLDIDERLFPLLERVEFDRSPLTDIKHCGPCDIGIIEGGICNAENVHVLREFRANCKILVAMGACAVTAACPRSATTSTSASACRRST
jgi:Ni,Fe-hydrogenase III small subunit